MPLDRATLVYEGGAPSLTLNGRVIDLGGPSKSSYRFAFSASHRVFRESFAANTAWFNFHAAAVEIDGRAVIIVAPPGGGKTLLALALVARGARLYTDEFVFVRRSDRRVSGLLANPFVREPAVHALGDERLTRLCAQSPGRLNDRGWHTWYQFSAEEIFDRNVTATAAPLAGVIVIDPASVADRPVRISSTVAAIDLACRLNAPTVGFARVADVADLVRDIPAYRMSIASVTDAADATMALAL